MSAGGQVHGQDSVAWFEEGEEHGEVGLTAGMRLHIGMLCTKYFQGPVNGKLLDGIDILATAIVAFSRIALGIFVGHHAALRLHHRT